MGEPVTWDYVVTNTGDITLVGVSVSDDQGVAVSCPQSSLAPGQSTTCTGSGLATSGQYRNVGTVTADSVDPLCPSVADSDASHYWGETEECSVCEGKVTELTMQFHAAAAAHVRIVAKRGPTTDEVFNGTLAPEETFTIVGPPSGNPGFSGTLGTEIRIYVDGTLHTTIHTSCSVPIGPGLVSGDFEVLEGYSSGGGLLCPL